MSAAYGHIEGKVLRAYSALKIVPAAGVRNSGSMGRRPDVTPPAGDHAE